MPFGLILRAAAWLDDKLRGIVRYRR